MEIRRIAQGKPQKSDQVIFDFAHVTMLDSTGVGIMVMCDAWPVPPALVPGRDLGSPTVTVALVLRFSISP
jgi:hypothetical protein